MDLRIEKWGVGFHIGVSRRATIKGVNSMLHDGKHFLMWDFDDVPLVTVRKELRAIQVRESLSKIYILSTGVESYYHAYCFTRRSWIYARRIIAGTPSVDRVFLVMAIMRGYLTLRISKKKDRELRLVKTLDSPIPENVHPDEVSSFVEYTTKRR